VLLSRAQHGLYLIGNADTYPNVQMWNIVLGLLRADDEAGRSIKSAALGSQRPKPKSRTREPSPDSVQKKFIS